MRVNGDTAAASRCHHLRASGVGQWKPEDHSHAAEPMMGVFAEFERAMIRDRVIAGLARMSALPPKADKEQTCWHVRFVPKADIRFARAFAIRSPRRHRRAAAAA